jgi:uncharacterized membrane protein
MGMDVATVATAVCCGVVAGVFFAFSVCIMQALERRPAAEGMAAMQQINRTIVNSPFILAFVGAAILCVVLAVWSLVSWDGGRSPWILGGAALYLLGGIVVTGAANVPLNDALDAADPRGAGAAAQWDHYVRVWTAWNHVRTVTGIAATALLIIAARAD